MQKIKECFEKNPKEFSSIIYLTAQTTRPSGMKTGTAGRRLATKATDFLSLSFEKQVGQ
jgi:hypothetical protein